MRDKIQTPVENPRFVRLARKIIKIVSGKGLEKIPLIARTYHFLLRKLSPVIYLDWGVRMKVTNGSIAHDLLVKGVYEPKTTSLFKKVIREGDIVVDVGAHIGYYTLLASRLVGDTGKVYAFEPEPRNYDLLLKNLELNNVKNVVAIKKAVSNKKGTLKFYLSKISLEHSTVKKIRKISRS